MLKIDKVSRRFGNKTAVDSVDLEIPEGQMVGIIGRSGAGKSTLLRMINRLTDPTRRRDPVSTAATSPRCTAPSCAPGAPTAP